MKLLIASSVLAILLFTAVTAAQDPPAGHPALNEGQFVGVWRGQMRGLPGADIVITNEPGQLTGAILFYLQTRSDLSDPWTATPGLPEPMFNLKIEGNTLCFRVSHRRAHPPRTLNDPPVSFRLTVTGPDKAELVSVTGSAPPVVMLRSAN